MSDTDQLINDSRCYDSCIPQSLMIGIAIHTIKDMLVETGDYILGEGEEWFLGEGGERIIGE